MTAYEVFRQVLGADRKLAISEWPRGSEWEAWLRALEGLQTALAGSRDLYLKVSASILVDSVKFHLVPDRVVEKAVWDLGAVALEMHVRGEG